MNSRSQHFEQWVADNTVLARIGVALYSIDTRLPVLLPRDLTDAATAAWNREEGADDSDVAETEVQRTVRHRAGTLALIGAAVERDGRQHTTDIIAVDLDARLVGLALDAADDHGLITGPPADRANPKPRFITIDLDIRGAPGQSLDALVDALARTGTVHQNDQRNDESQFVSFALGQHHETIKSNLTSIVAVVAQLGPQARTEWDHAASRVFNVGIQAGREPDQPVLTLDAELITSAATHAAGITFTHYPDHDRSARFTHTSIN